MIQNANEFEAHNTQNQTGSDPGSSTIGHSYDMNIPNTPYADTPSPSQNPPSDPGETETPTPPDTERELTVPNPDEATNPEQDDASYPEQNEIISPRENEVPFSSPDESGSTPV